MTYISKNITPDILPNFLRLNVNASNNTAAKIANAPSNRNAELKGIGNINPATPSTNSILNILEPTILPIAISDSPLRAAIILVTSSGRLVPNAIIVRPITRSDTPIYCAISMADNTVILLPNISAISPKMINDIIFIVLICLIDVSVFVLPHDMMNKYAKNNTKRSIKTLALNLEIMPYCIPNQHNNSVINIINGISKRTVFFCTVNVDINAVVPSIRNIFAILEPITFPIAIAFDPANADDILTAASGALVPMATTVNPIIIGGIFNRAAIADAPSTK